MDLCSKSRRKTIMTSIFTYSLNLFQNHYHRVYHHAYLNVIRISSCIFDDQVIFIKHATNKIMFKVTCSDNKIWKLCQLTRKASLITGALNVNSTHFRSGFFTVVLENIRKSRVKKFFLYVCVSGGKI